MWKQNQTQTCNLWIYDSMVRGRVPCSPSESHLRLQLMWAAGKTLKQYTLASDLHPTPKNKIKKRRERAETSTSLSIKGEKNWDKARELRGRLLLQPVFYYTASNLTISFFYPEANWTSDFNTSAQMFAFHVHLKKMHSVVSLLN